MENRQKSKHSLFTQIKYILDKSYRDNIPALAGQSAFFLLLSAIPLILFVFSMLSLLTGKDLKAEDFAAIQMQGMVPYFDKLINYIVDSVRKATSGTAIITAIVMLWSAGKGMYCITDGILRVYRIPNNKFWLLRRIYAMGYTIVMLLILFRQGMTAGVAVQCLLLIAYGIRLGGYLLLREVRSPAYKKVLNPELDRSRQMGIVPKVALWISCALLYTMQTSPVFFRLLNGDGTGATVIAGAVIMAAGLLLEGAADLQKSSAKKREPYRFVDTGLYRLVRCPNYLGEMVFWLGVLISGVGSLHGALQWVVAAGGFILIVFVMFSGARRLEIRQNRNYGEDPEYQKYVKTVPILLPFVPLYSVEKYKFLMA